MSGALLLAHGNVLDAEGTAFARDTDVLLVDGRIAAVGRGLLAPPGAERFDATGLYVAPGLVDAHVHLMTVPGEPYLLLSPEAHAAMRRHQLRSYLACGVTTVLDTAIPHDVLAETRGWIEAGAAAPRVLSLGRAIGPHGGYPENMSADLPGVGTRAEIRTVLDEVQAIGAVGTKVTFERGFGGPDWPVLSADLRAAFREEAAARGLPVYVHAMSPEDYLDSADLAPRAFVHAPERPDAAARDAIVLSGAYVVTTLTLYDAALVPLDEARLADPLVQLAVPPEQIAAARDRDVVARARRDLAAFAVPWAPGFLARWNGAARAIAKGKQRKAVAALQQLHEAGVPLVVGTDSGTWPFIHAQFHGPATLREIEMLGELGLRPAAALAAATSVPARMLGLEDRIGSVEPGKDADLVVLRANPLDDLSALRQVALVVRAGVARTPSGWMALE